MNSAPTWNSLEVAKLVVAAFTPVAVAFLGFWIARHLRRVEQLQWASQKAVEKRLEVFTALAPILNDLYCYFDFIGEWKMKDPRELLLVKRNADRCFYVNAALFSPSFQRLYEVFMAVLFVPGPLEEHETAARIKSDVAVRKEMFARRGEKWKAEWDGHFVSKGPIPKHDEILAAYQGLMAAFVRELGVELAGNRQ
jgi:hypothetical protein